ncbi:protein YhfH [Heyndrickxia camelliae]|uniref:YhfH family protein n=1 Tax=Heyndrickxia camelliae TaxID=1707093 RepID=A0A2N3LDX3_9BACI|nr:protein YhfH [Heyndrickxia camelliae]PKR82775.1 YhfH family protein [Heyndrickxia camelliae]
MLGNPVEFFRNLSRKICPECGEHIHEEQAESYIMECERCLAKKEE